MINQLRRHSIAIISLVVALSSLSYNTWRNEKTEYNRNQRQASFEILLKLNALQQVVFYNHYEQDTLNRGNPRLGWTYILTIRDLSMILRSPLPEQAQSLLNLWEQNWEVLDRDVAAKNAIEAGMDQYRQAILKLLQSLE
ncbi:hypothetical protein [Marinicella sp. W31]|uniref:hypothetical protein n=1 Tax=Marinicella sp. W31 TaxID=3023713 RepID=UPI00375846B9